MDGHVNDETLLTFTLGLSSDEERATVDPHLLTCPSCLRAFLDLKRQIERGATPAPRPSAAPRDKLRASVAAAFRPSVAVRFGRALRRPIPLYQGMAAAALALAVAVLAPVALHGLPMSPPGGERVDTARLSPESFTIY